MTLAVSNAGPLMVLAKLHLLHLLAELYDQVRIPRSVYAEAVGEGLRQGYADASTLHHFLERVGWEPEDVNAEAIPVQLQSVPLDAGERDALALALRIGDVTVLMDEADEPRHLWAKELGDGVEQGRTLRGILDTIGRTTPRAH